MPERGEAGGDGARAHQHDLVPGGARRRPARGTASRSDASSSSPLLRRDRRRPDLHDASTVDRRPAIRLIARISRCPRRTRARPDRCARRRPHARRRARARAPRPSCRRRCCTYSIASRLVRSAMATTRSAAAARHPPRAVVVADDGEALLGRAQHHERLGLGFVGARLADQRAEPAEELVEALPGDRRDARSPSRSSSELGGGDVGLAARRRAAAVRAARAGSGRARRAAPAPAPRASGRRRGARSRRSTSTRARSTWRRNWCPRPAPSAAPSMRPGMSATHELVVPEAHDAEVGLERGERVVGDLRLRRADRRDQRRLARVREPDERGVGEQLHLEAQPVLLAVLALLGEARRAARVREEAGVAAAALPAVGGEVAVAVAHEVGEDLAVARSSPAVPSGTVTTRSSPLEPWRLLPDPCLPDSARRCGWSRNDEQRRRRCGRPAGRRRRRCRRRRRRGRPWARAPRGGTTPHRRRRHRRGG